MGAKLWWRNFPWVLVLILLLLLGVGLLFIRSASFSTKTGSYLPYARLQMIWILVGSTAFVVVLAVPARWIERFAYPAYVLSLLLLLSLFFIGNGHVVFPLYLVGIEIELVFRFHVIKYRHLSITHDY